MSLSEGHVYINKILCVLKIQVQIAEVILSCGEIGILVCYSVAGSQNTVFWFALVSLTIMTLSIIGEISRRSKKNHR